ncbi:MAG: hypothetical protein K0R34_2652 [Herbinix sp.]|jgi:hypothetical protein|nr:hypothetical protein [Herbinix sp.]
MFNNDKKFYFGVIFAIGLMLCLFSEDLFSNSPISNVNALTFSILIALFGGGGLLIAIFKGK